MRIQVLNRYVIQIQFGTSRPAWLSFSKIYKSSENTISITGNLSSVLLEA